MRTQIVVGFALIGSMALLGQPPAPPPWQAPVTTINGSITQFNYGPDGSVDSVIVAQRSLVRLPREWAMQVEMLVKAGTSMRVTGPAATAASGMQLMDAQTVEVAGKTFTMFPPSQPAPYAGSGTIRTLNYGREGEVNGFLLQNGVIACTPPFGSADISVIRPGAGISFSGFARVTPSGRTVVEVQSITANGQTIAMNRPPDPGPEPGPRGRKGKRGDGPPPPPPPAAFAPQPPPPPVQ